MDLQGEPHGLNDRYKSLSHSLLQFFVLIMMKIPPRTIRFVPSLPLGLLIFASVCIAGVLFDVGYDLAHCDSNLHVGIEILAAVFSTVGFVAIFLKVNSRISEQKLLLVELSGIKEEAKLWRNKAAKFIDGLSVEIDNQLDRWGLSAAEKEICYMLLKGFGIREIAALRDTKESTVRGQAQAIYSKAGIAGRAELASFFLEDLLSPAKESA